jgi:opacity protein-like surface antigen
MKRLLILLSFALLVACNPAADVTNNVLPTLVSITIDDVAGQVTLQGRYFGDGFAGQSDNSFVIVGADIDGRGGARVEASSWDPSRIIFQAPQGAGFGFVFVVVDGVRSNGIPGNLP